MWRVLRAVGVFPEHEIESTALTWREIFGLLLDVDDLPWSRA